MVDSTHSPPSDRDSATWLLPLLYALLVSCYFVVRFDGGWIDNDSAVLTLAVRSVLEEQTIRPEGPGYGYGFAYQSIVVFVKHLTGSELQVLLDYYLPFFGPFFLAVTSFAFFRKLSNSYSIASIGTLILLLQPDILFVLLRGSHEKFTLPLIAAILFVNVISISEVDEPANRLALVGVSYLIVFSLASTNVFFTTTLLALLFLAVIFGVGLYLLRRNMSAGRSKSKGLNPYFGLSSSVILIILMFYLYEPAQGLVRSLEGVSAKIALVLGGFERSASPYDIISFGWTSPWVYLLLSSPTLLVLAGSFVSWITKLRKFSELSNLNRVVWLLYFAGGLQLIVAILVDFSGVLGRNLQVRLLPTFLLIAVPVILQNSGWSRRIVRVGAPLIALGICATSIFGVLSLLKATNDPALSNYWSFYSPSEEATLKWADEHIEDTSIWVDQDAVRLGPLAQLQMSTVPASNQIDVGEPHPITTDFVISRTVEAWSARNGVPLPTISDDLRVYDNGTSRIYHRRPLTPFQD